MQRLHLGLILALSLSIGTSSVSAVEHQPNQQNPYTHSHVGIVAQANKTAENNFVPVEHSTQGQANIIEVDGQRYLELSQDFKTDRGPALRVILHQNNSVGLKVQPDSYISLGNLQAFSGTQRYLIPNNLDLAGFQSVAIWCEEFNATFGYAPLAQ